MHRLARVVFQHRVGEVRVIEAPAAAGAALFAPAVLLDEDLHRAAHEGTHVGGEETVRRVIRMVDVNEYKRRQGPIGVKITPRAFGRDWRLPIVNRFRER